MRVCLYRGMGGQSEACSLDLPCPAEVVLLLRTCRATSVGHDLLRWYYCCTPAGQPLYAMTC